MVRRLFAPLAACALLAVSASTASAATDQTPPGTPPEVLADPGGMASGNGNLTNARNITSSSITAANIAKLKPAWKFDLTNAGLFGAISSNPVISGGVLYFADGDSNAYALDAATGKLKWKTMYNRKGIAQNAPTLANGRIFMGVDSDVVGLDARTGKQLWRTTLNKSDNSAVDMSPLAWGNMIVVSTIPFLGSKGIYLPGQRGIVYGIDATTGRKLWSFDTTAGPSRSGKSALFNGRDVLASFSKTSTTDLWGRPDVNSGGGLWSTPSIDEHGTLFMDVANPAPFPGTPKYPNGSSRPGPNLYTNSLVALNARTGKLKWYYQAIPHDLRDYDLETPPILTTFTMRGKPRDVVVVAGKMGTVYVVDRTTGKLLWKRNVGKHNRWGNPKRPFPTKKKDFPVTVLPGDLGGVETPMAVSHGTIYVPVVNLCNKLHGQVNYPAGVELCDFAKGTGELVALDGATGHQKWKRTVPTEAFGAATVVNDAVVLPGFNGKIYMFRRKDGKLLASPSAGAGVNAPPAFTGDTMYLGAGIPTTSGATLTAWRLP
jgi:alcohol dehydrogenase (cytochrome c)